MCTNIHCSWTWHSLDPWKSWSCLGLNRLLSESPWLQPYHITLSHVRNSWCLTVKVCLVHGTSWMWYDPKVARLEPLSLSLDCLQIREISPGRCVLVKEYQILCAIRSPQRPPRAQHCSRPGIAVPPYGSQFTVSPAKLKKERDRTTGRHKYSYTVERID